jgi:hypothetical protein
MRVASLSLGIVAYTDARLATSSAKLQFAADDARVFHRYARAAWPGEDGLHLLLNDGEATAASVARAFSEIAASSPYELFLLYMSGHGEAVPEGGWFYLADAVSGSPSLTRAELDGLLEGIVAEEVLVVADYCHAEASLAGSAFFGSLRGTSARFFIASARTSQKAWEDDALERSILSDLLLRGLASTSPLADRDGTLDVETQLVPFLREQVPLEAASRKRGAVQEPVFGGVGVTGIRLPTVSATDMRRTMTIAQTLRARLRRIIGIGAAASLGAWLILDLLFFHLAAGPAGEIRVRPGLAALYQLAPFHLGTEIDTGFSAADLKAGDQDAFRRLSRGEEIGLATHKDRDRLSTWLAILEPSLNGRARRRALMLARGTLPRHEASSDPPPIREAAFLALAAGASRRAVADALYPAPPPADLDCNRPTAQQIDFGLLDIPSEPFARDLAWRALRIDHSRHAGELAELVKPVSYRIASGRSAVAAADLEALAAAVDEIAQGPGLVMPQLSGWCENPAAALVRALAGAPREQIAAQAALTAALPRMELEPGAEWPAREAAAIAALNALSSRIRLHPDTVNAIASSFATSGEALGLDTPLNRLLLTTALHQPLPTQVRATLFRTARAAADPSAFEALAAFRLLARNSRFLTASELKTMRVWLDRFGPQNRTISEFHEALGNLAWVIQLGPEEIGWLAARLSPDSWLPPATVSYRGETVIAASDAEAAIALGKVAQRQQLPEETMKRLRTIAANRRDLPERAMLLRGLAGPRGAQRDAPAAILDDVRAAKGSALMRSLAIDVAVERLSALPPAETGEALLALLDIWKRLRAPEDKMAIATIIGAASRGGRLAP